MRLGLRSASSCHNPPPSRQGAGAPSPPGALPGHTGPTGAPEPAGPGAARGGRTSGSSPNGRQRGRRQASPGFMVLPGHIVLQGHIRGGQQGPQVFRGQEFPACSGADGGGTARPGPGAARGYRIAGSSPGPPAPQRAGPPGPQDAGWTDDRPRPPVIPPAPGATDAASSPPGAAGSAGRNDSPLPSPGRLKAPQ